MDGYEEINFLGKGSYGVVVSAKQSTDQTVAIKLVPAIDPKQTGEMLSMTKVLSGCSHRNIVSIKNVYDIDSASLNVKLRSILFKRFGRNLARFMALEMDMCIGKYSGCIPVGF